MERRIPILFFGLSFLLFCSCQKATPLKTELSQNWQFRQADSTVWYPANVPGCNFTDLIYNGLTEDPFFGANEKKLFWVEETDWEYKTSFYGDELLHFEKTELVFEGLDTYADVYLNDSLVLTANNMFRRWVIDLTGVIKPELNNVYIRFYYPSRIEKDKAAELSYRLPDERGFTRKAPYQYGWDWGPRFVTSGIWKPVYFRCWESIRLGDIHIVQNSVNDQSANLSANVEVFSTKTQKANLTLELAETGAKVYQLSVDLNEGVNMFTIPFRVDDPELWWPNGMGEQMLYDVRIELNTSDNMDEKTERIGIREISFVHEKDSIGENFYFTINGKPVFIKGANYIPQDNFPSRVTDDHFRDLVRSAAEANMNMLRVWGGGIYEKDIFYDLCDEYGILVWQDFMFACNMYPGDTRFLKNVKHEAIEQVKRLRNHPSLALWCGNNEVKEGWINWGWQGTLNYSEADSLEVWNNYLAIFEDLLPDVVKTYDPSGYYWPSSPSIGWGHEEALYSGDMHYWGVWWGAEPFEVYEQKVGRFMSEYGFQGFPDMRTFDSCLMPEDKKLSSEALLNHQKHPRGMELIETYMAREYHIPHTFADYAYVSQLVQAYGIRKAIEAHRRAMPVCMGTLYWQLNDCWPVISWSSIDYYNNWKALHYFARDTYEKILVSFLEKDDQIEIYIISEEDGLISTHLNLMIMDFYGDTLWKANKQIKIDEFSSKIYYTLKIRDLPVQVEKKKVVLVATVAGDRPFFTSNLFYFEPPKLLILPEPEIEVMAFSDQLGNYVDLKTRNLAKNVYLHLDEPGNFSANYFDLLPGDSIRIRFNSPEDELGAPHQINNFEKRLKVKSLVEIY